MNHSSRSKWTYTLFFYTLLFFLCASCNSNRSIGHLSDSPLFYFSQDEKSKQEYLNIVTLHDSKNSSIESYKLISAEELDHFRNDQYTIPIPLKKVVCMSSSHIAAISALGAESVICAVSGSEYLSNKVVNNMISSGQIRDIGFEASLNYELLISLQPDVIFTYGISGHDNTYIEKLKKLGLRVVVLSDYLEAHPLGKMEYLRLFGHLLNLSERADSIFNARERRYEELCHVVKEANPERKKVLLNTPWKDVWYIPGKESNFSRLLSDAGGDIVGSKEGINSFPYSAEEIFLLAKDADFWLNTGNISTLQQLTDDNPIFTKLAVYKQGRIFNNIKRRNLKGGNDFWENGVIEPHLILEDLIRILHPNIIGPGEFHYYIEVK